MTPIHIWALISITIGGPGWTKAEAVEVGKRRWTSQTSCLAEIRHHHQRVPGVVRILEYDVLVCVQTTDWMRTP